MNAQHVSVSHPVGIVYFSFCYPAPGAPWWQYQTTTETYSHIALAIDLKYSIWYNREWCLYDETKGGMIEISALLASVTKVIHLHFNDWPLLVTFCWNVNKLFCLSLLSSAYNFSDNICCKLISFVTFMNQYVHFELNILLDVAQLRICRHLKFLPFPCVNSLNLK